MRDKVTDQQPQPNIPTVLSESDKVLSAFLPSFRSGPSLLFSRTSALRVPPREAEGQMPKGKRTE